MEEIQQIDKSVKKLAKKIFKQKESISKKHQDIISKIQRTQLGIKLQKNDSISIEPQTKIVKYESQMNHFFDNQLKLPSKQHKKWQIKKILAGHEGWINCLDFDKDNEFFASGSTDSQIKFWDLVSGQLKLSLIGHVASVRDLKISKQHVYLYSCSEDRTVKCWDLTTNKCIRTFHGHLSGVYSIDIHPNQNLIASGGRDASVRLWDIRTRNQIQCFEGHRDTVFSVSLQEDEPQLMSGSADCTIRLWDITTGKKFKSLTHHKKSVRQIYPHPIEYSFISLASDGIKLWKCPDGEYIRSFQNSETKGVWNSMDVSGEDLVVSGNDQGQLGFWDWQSGELVSQIDVPSIDENQYDRGILSVKFDLSSLRLLTGGTDKCVKIWEQINQSQKSILIFQ